MITWPWQKRRLLEERAQATQQKLKDLEQKIANQHNHIRTTEKRLYEATQVKRDLTIGHAPNLRQHWQAKPIRDQARFLYDNDPTTRRAFDSVVCNMVGKGVVPIARSMNKEAERQVEAYFKNWQETTEGDYDRTHNLAGLQSLAVLMMIRDGSAFVRAIPRRRQLFLQLLEAEYLDIQKNGENPRNGNEIINGIEYDKRTLQRVAYWLWEQHPDDAFSSPGGRGSGVTFDVANPMTLSVSGLGIESQRIPASMVGHLRRIDRAGQQDGISWIAPALIKIWDLREYEEAKLKQQKLQASFTAFVQDNYALTEEERMDLVGMTDQGIEKQGERIIAPGHVEELPPGKTITFPSPTGTTDEKFVERSLRSIAATLGISYEIFNDYSQVSYSSGRMGFLEMDRNLKHIMRTVVEPQFLYRISQWVLNHLEMNGIIPKEHGVRVEWTPPARELIDPDAEGRALASMVGANLMSLREAHATLGKDLEHTLEDITWSNERLVEAGLTPLGYNAGTAMTLGVQNPESGKEVTEKIESGEIETPEEPESNSSPEG